MSVMLEPLSGDPAKVHEFITDNLFAPLEGTDEAKREQAESVIAQMGGIDNVRKMQEASRRIAERRRQKAEAAAAADDTTAP